MKILLGADLPPEHWFKPSHDSDDIRNHLELLSSKAVLGLSEESWFDLVGQRQIFGIAKIIQNAVIQKTCIARVSSSNQCDMAISLGQKIHNLLQDAVFEDKYEFHAHDLEIGESRESFFSRKVGHLLPAAVKFEFLDSYFSQNIVKRTRGARFVLERCLEAQLPEIEIHTFEDELNEATISKHIDLVHESISSLIADSSRTSKLSVKIYGGSRDEFPHDRFGEIAFLNKSVGFSIGQGTEVFKEFSTRPSPVFEPIKKTFESLRNFLDSKELLDELIY